MTHQHARAVWERDRFPLNDDGLVDAPDEVTCSECAGLLADPDYREEWKL